MVARSAITYVTEDDNIQDPTDGIKVLNQFLLVRPVSISSKFKSTSGFELLMPDTVKEAAQQLVAMGRVIGVGDKAGVRSGVSKLEVGDYILFPKHSGDKITINGVKCIVMYDDTPIAVVDPTKISLVASN